MTHIGLLCGTVHQVAQETDAREGAAEGCVLDLNIIAPIANTAIDETRPLHSSSDLFQKLRNEPNRKKPKFECNGLVTTDEHPTVTDAILTICGTIHTTATILEVLVATKLDGAEPI